MKLFLDPTVLDEARAILGFTSDEQLAQKILGVSGQTVRNWRNGVSAPSIGAIARLFEITGRPIETMLDRGSAVAA